MEMQSSWFIRGFLMGLAVAVPVGPIGILCIRRSLSFGSRTGFVTGLGAATADALYAGLAAFGLTAVSGVFVAGQNYIRAAGALMLIYLGLKALLPGQPDESGVGRMQTVSNYFSTVALTLANPATIVSFLALFSATMPVASGPYLAAILTLGVFMGSAAWWLVLSSGVGLIRSHVGAVFVRLTNILSGAVLLGFAVYALATLAV